MIKLVVNLGRGKMSKVFFLLHLAAFYVITREQGF